jgi:hypothetical protein
MVKLHVLYDQVTQHLEFIHQFMTLHVEFIEICLQPIQELYGQPEGHNWIVRNEEDIPLKLVRDDQRGCSSEIFEELIGPFSEVRIEQKVKGKKDVVSAYQAINDPTQGSLVVHVIEIKELVKQRIFEK